MVNAAFICEDDAGKRIIESADFKKLLIANNLNLISPVFNAKGKGNLTEENVTGIVNLSIGNGASVIFILVDMDDDKCITLTKKNIIEHPDCKIIVCKKAVEAWFLADSKTLSSLLKTNAYYDFPEEPVQPFEVINQLHKTAFNGRGISKAILPIKLINDGFSILNAANHPECYSASYFIKKLQSIAQ